VTRAARAGPPKPYAGQPGVCCWCGGALPKGRRSWCSQRCVDEYLIQTPAGLREAVLKRDHGVCAQCGRDCEGLKNRLDAIVWGFYRGVLGEQALRGLLWKRMLDRLGLRTALGYLRSFWEADHIVPLCEGGTNVLDNLRTLCICCHKSETAALAKRRAARRRQQLSLELEGDDD